MMGYREDSAGNEYGWIRSISLIAFETYIIDESAICFCVGIAQQWGCNAKGNREVVFPIGFSNITYSFAYSLNYGSGAIAWDEVLPSAQADITSATYRTENKQKVGPRVGNWIVIGFQQWGHKDNSTSIVTFNLSFPTTCFIALVETLNDGTVNCHLRVSGATNVGFSTWDSATNRPYSIQNYWLALGI